MEAMYLNGLNPAQSRAVQHPPHIPLQILAGPGSGKTKVLTSRIAHLIAYYCIPPAAICAVTFTNKAANELQERLTRLVGKGITTEIKMGTFHSICARFLRRYSTLVGVGANFTVCDAEESKKIIRKLLIPYSDYLEQRDVVLKEGTVQSHISKAKAKGHTPQDLEDRCAEVSKRNARAGCKNEKMPPMEVIAQVVAQIYGQYQIILKDNNSLDFDDLLVYGVKLFRDNPNVGKWCTHVLVDEFQDTNAIQYQLMSYIAAAKRCLTIVGDPDQSIYGWRSAEVENLTKMRKDFPSTEQILLEQNYRSTGAILEASVAIVSQDVTRIPKTLHTTHATGPLPVLHAFPTEQIEASSIASEIKRLIAYTGGMLTWKDFVVLLRMNSASRGIENALQKEGIPNRLLGGHRFFERMEVKDLLAYLQVIDNPKFIPAFTRIINIPGRGIGEKTIAEILQKAGSLKLSPLEVVERIHDGKLADIKPPVKRKIGSFVQAMKKLRKLATDGEYPEQLIRQLLDLIKYEDHLKKTQQDFEGRWDNVQELINFATEFESSAVLDAAEALSNKLALARTESQEDDWMDATEYDDLDDLGFPDAKEAKKDNGKARQVISDGEETPLRAFLQASMLSTDTETNEDEETKKDKVTIATCHAAKGLEWPVVFVPAVEKGMFPSARADDIEEERRLLYVACTRAQGFLYLSHCAVRMAMGQSTDKELSEFITAVQRAEVRLFRDSISDVTSQDRATIATVLNRPVPEADKVKKMIEEYHRISKPALCSFSSLSAGSCQTQFLGQFQSRGSSRNTINYGLQIHSEYDEFPTSSGSATAFVAPATFTSARATISTETKPSVADNNHRVTLLSPSRKVSNIPARLQPQSAAEKRPAKVPSTSGEKQALTSHQSDFFGYIKSEPGLALGKPKGPVSRPGSTSVTQQPVSSPQQDRRVPDLLHASRKPRSQFSTREDVPSAARTLVVKQEDQIPYLGSISSSSRKPAPLPAPVARSSNLSDMTRKFHVPSSANTEMPATARLVSSTGDRLPKYLERPAVSSQSSSPSNASHVTAYPDHGYKPSIAAPVTGKRRLGMGSHTSAGYSNKKFKVPMK